MSSKACFNCGKSFGLLEIPTSISEDGSKELCDRCYRTIGVEMNIFVAYVKDSATDLEICEAKFDNLESKVDNADLKNATKEEILQYTRDLLQKKGNVEGRQILAERAERKALEEERRAAEEEERRARAEAVRRAAERKAREEAECKACEEAIEEEIKAREEEERIAHEKAAEAERITREKEERRQNIEQIHQITATSFDGVPIKFETKLVKNIGFTFSHSDVFEECGSKIKSASKVFLALGAIGSIILAITAGIEADSFWLGAGIAVAGTIISYLSSLFLFGFGHIIELLESINYNQKNMRFTSIGIISSDETGKDK